MAAHKTYPHGTTIVSVGTKRGLFLLTSQDRERWNIESTELKGSRVYYTVLDQRAGCRLFAADNGDFFGSFLRYSDDFGLTWKEPAQNIQFPQEQGQSLKNIWTIEPGRATEADTLYAGTDPAALWVSTDNGKTWDPDPGLLAHPTYRNWEPGAGGLCLHTIVADPSNTDRMWVGISAVGCLRTDDGGRSWSFANKNVRAGFLPDPYPEFGQCIHRMVQHPLKPDVLYQQNHCGIYKSLDGGNEWIDIQANLPSEFGFPIALDAHHPETLFVVVEDPSARHNVTEQFTVYRTENGGESWEPLTRGLPRGSGVCLGVLRHAMCADTEDPCGVYVGTNTGQLFASNNRGESWQLIADFLPPIYSVTVATLG
ncbi:exo-alpha-sialidase [Ktedonosporobacter rubrisoli]|uniref:Exo-alpha-sialidase n=1 Tax=Ktedonosporobacter rubrisoli TaxID=2509675 RepID=A0A4P6JUN2_KTERU|nr:sialidase family protein [Ktedonosporobacter rubrisoli]QBD79012.1 exo-alpha-sialidase [Ktedonosporobacter rubrisoli]